jgi:hypothetical protein
VTGGLIIMTGANNPLVPAAASAGATLPQQPKATPVASQANDFIPRESYNKAWNTWRNKESSMQARITQLETENAQLSSHSEILQAEVNKPYTSEELKNSAEAIRKVKEDAAKIVTDANKELGTVRNERKSSFVKKIMSTYSTLGLNEADLLKFGSTAEISDHVMQQVLEKGWTPSAPIPAGEIPPPPSAEIPPPPPPPEVSSVIIKDWHKMTPDERVSQGLKEKTKV